MAQNALMPSISSLLTFGFTSLLIYSFSSCISFRSGSNQETLEVFSPPSSTFGITFRRWLMYLLHFATSTVAQNALMPSISSLLTFGFTSLLIYSLSSCHKFSIGFKSGGSGGVFHHFIPLCVSHTCAYLEVCYGSLSCINLCPLG